MNSARVPLSISPSPATLGTPGGTAKTTSSTHSKARLPLQLEHWGSSGGASGVEGAMPRPLLLVAGSAAGEAARRSAEEVPRSSTWSVRQPRECEEQLDDVIIPNIYIYIDIYMYYFFNTVYLYNDSMIIESRLAYYGWLSLERPR